MVLEIAEPFIYLLHVHVLLYFENHFQRKSSAERYMKAVEMITVNFYRNLQVISNDFSHSKS